MNNSGLVISPIDILKLYKIAKFKTQEQMLTFVAKKQGFTQAGGVLQTDKAAQVVLDDIIDGKIKYYSEVPASSN
jgi:ribosome biogenesis GTPase A